MTKLFESLNAHYKFHIIINISYMIISNAETAGRVCHFGSVCDAADAMRISVETHQIARLGNNQSFSS